MPLAKFTLLIKKKTCGNTVQDSFPWLEAILHLPSWCVVLRHITYSLFIAQSTWMKDFGRELFVYLFNPLRHEAISHKVIFFNTQADDDILNTELLKDHHAI